MLQQQIENVREATLSSKKMENRPNIDRGNGLSSFTKVTRVIPKYFKCFILWYDMHLPLKTKQERRRRRAEKKEEES